MDSDILTFIITASFLLIVGLVNSYRNKYKMGIRRWIGAFFLVTGIWAFLTKSGTMFSPEWTAGLTIALIGVLSLFVKPKLKEKSKKKH